MALDAALTAEFDRLSQEWEAQQAGAAESNVKRLGARTNPDEEAEFQELSKNLGIGIESIRSNPAMARQTWETVKQGAEDLKKNPTTSKFLNKEQNAAVAHDDVANLREYEDLIRSEPEVDALDVAGTLPAGALQGVGMGFSGTGELYGAYSRTVNRLFGTKYVDDYLAETFPETARVTNKVLRGMFDFERSLKWAGGNIKRSGKMMDLTDEERAGLSYWENVGVDVTTGTGQVAGQILTYMANPALGTANLLGQGADQQAMRQMETGTLGQDNMSDLGIITGAAVTAATEKWAIEKYLNRLPPKIKSRIMRNVADVFIAGGQEALQEVVEGILQGLTEYATTNPDAEIVQGLDREALAAGGTGIVVRSIINMLTPGKGVVDPSIGAAYKESGKRVGSEYDQERIEQRIYLAQQSKLNNRAGDAYSEFLEDVAPNEYVFVRPEVLTDMENLPEIVKQQLDGTGANVAMTMNMFLTEVVKNEEMLERIRPHIVMREDHLTQDELKSKEMSTDVKRMIENAQRDTEAMTEAETIYEEVRNQLEQTLRQGKDTARMSAQLIPAMVVSQRAELAKMGKEVSVRDLYNDMGLKIVGPEPKINNNREVFAQDLLTEKDGKVGFKQDRIDYIIRENAYPGDKTEGFVVYVDPRQFLPATTPDESQRLMVGAETGPLDQTRLTEEIQTPFLGIIEDEGGWRIDNHEGRHRLTALALAGYTQVPIVLKTEGPVSKNALKDLETLAGDVWSGVEAPPIDVFNPTPLTWDNKGKLSQEFGLGSSPDILYQRDQDFGDMEISEVMDDGEGGKVRITEKYQDQWDHHQKRLDMVEALRKCLKK